MRSGSTVEVRSSIAPLPTDVDVVDVVVLVVVLCRLYGKPLSTLNARKTMRMMMTGASRNGQTFRPRDCGATVDSGGAAATIGAGGAVNVNPQRAQN